jgi:hypothetical protein
MHSPHQPEGATARAFSTFCESKGFPSGRE